MEHLIESISNDKSFEAKLHGMKMKNCLPIQDFDEKSDKALDALANKRYEEMMEGK